MNDSHWIITRTPLRKIESFDTYGAAAETYALVQKHHPLVADNLAIRSDDDPALRWVYVEKSNDVCRLVSSARREARHNEIGHTARWAIDGNPTASFDRLMTIATESLRERGFKVERWEVQQPLKDRVLLGRCPQHGGFWTPKRNGPLHKLRCPHCGSRLHQTSLALRSGFRGGVNVEQD